MTFKVTFDNNEPADVVETKPGVILKKYNLSEDGKTIFDWIVVDADSESEAGEKARQMINKANKEG